MLPQGRDDWSEKWNSWRLGIWRRERKASLREGAACSPCLKDRLKEGEGSLAWDEAGVAGRARQSRALWALPSHAHRVWGRHRSLTQVILKNHPGNCREPENKGEEANVDVRSPVWSYWRGSGKRWWCSLAWKWSKWVPEILGGKKWVLGSGSVMTNQGEGNARDHF